MYVRPGTAARAALATYQAQVPDPTPYGLAWQPPEQAHLTVARIDASPEQVDQQRLHHALTQDIPGLGEVDARLMRVGPPQVGACAAEVWVEPSPVWAPLVLHARNAAAVAGIADDRLHASPRPHLALGYGIGDGDSGALADALKRVRQQIVEFEVSELHLASVRYTSAGTFTWDSIARVPLPQPRPLPGMRPSPPSQAPRPGDLDLD